MNAELPSWPAVMTTTHAAGYLDISENSFRALARREGVKPLNLGMTSVRWRRLDLDQMVEGLALRGERVEETQAETIQQTIARLEGRKP